MQHLEPLVNKDRPTSMILLGLNGGSWRFRFFKFTLYCYSSLKSGEVRNLIIW